jgi:hypothetical protein
MALDEESTIYRAECEDHEYELDLETCQGQLADACAPTHTQLFLVRDAPIRVSFCPERIIWDTVSSMEAPRSPMEFGVTLQQQGKDISEAGKF